MSGFPVCIFCLFALPGPAVAAQDMRTEEVHFNRGESRTTIMGKVTGCQTVDYHVRGGAGQTLAVTLKPSSPSAYFNVLPPGATDAAMFVGSHAGNRLKRVLTDDGTYMIRVYLMRHAARLNKSSTYSLAISVTGTALVPIPSSIDATVPGTRFHASAQVACVPPYAYDTGEQACEAFVIRRGFDGTATVEIRSANG
jgi:hypothetical protein